MMNKFPFRNRIESKTKKYDDGDPNNFHSPSNSNNGNNTTTAARFRGFFSSPSSSSSNIKKSTTLPTTRSSTTSRHHHRHLNNTSPCSAFLMGGNYYPGKDNRNRRVISHQQNNKQNIYYRLLKCFIIFFICVIILLYIITIIISYIKLSSLSLSYNNKNNDHHNRIKSKINLPLFHTSTFNKKKKNSPLVTNIEIDLYEEENKLKLLLSDTTSFLKIKSLHEMKDLYDNKEYGSFVSKQKELIKKVIENIIPKFAHRNDPDYKPLPIKEDDDTIDKENDTIIETTSSNNNKQLVKDDESTKNDKKETTKKSNISSSSSSNLRTLSNMITNNTSSCPLPTEISITLVFQCTLDRLWLLRITCSRWTDYPIIVVIFSLSSIDENVGIHELKASCMNLDIIFYNPTTSATDYNESKKEYYPINKLRNIGINAVQTSHYLILDIDFIPSKNLQTILSQQQDNDNDNDYISILKSSNYNLFIIPAFERLSKCSTINQCQQLLSSTSQFLPQDVEELNKCINKNNCIVFQENNNIDGHSTTNSKLWLNQNTRYGKIDPRIITCFNSIRYEPYIILRNCPNTITPYYDERFHGYGKNKISYISHLRFLNFNWRVLPKGFVIHYPHPESSIKEIWNDRDNNAHKLHHDMDELYPKFIRELMERYGNKPIMPSCV